MKEIAKVDDIQLTAKTPSEMLTAQAHLVEWCDKKIDSVRAEVKELEEATLHAKTHKWKFSTLERHWKLAIKRQRFYEKMKSALLAGYYIVPNFPVQMFAIRTDRRKPIKAFSTRSWDNHEQKLGALTQGEGDYKSPFPVIYQQTNQLSEGKSETQYYPEMWNDVEFPMSMAKPEIMEAVSDAMALKIFDRFGIFPGTKKEDPVILGQIIQKTSLYREKVVSFMIAWHINTNVL